MLPPSTTTACGANGGWAQPRLGRRTRPASACWARRRARPRIQGSDVPAARDLPENDKKDTRGRAQGDCSRRGARAASMRRGARTHPGVVHLDALGLRGRGPWRSRRRRRSRKSAAGRQRVCFAREGAEDGGHERFENALDAVLADRDRGYDYQHVPPACPIAPRRHAPDRRGSVAA